MTGTRSSAAFYADSLDAFLRASDDEVYAPLTSPHGYTLAPEQLSAWRLQLPILRAALRGLARVPQEQVPVPVGSPWLHLEFDIPRLGRRVDAVLVTSTAVLPIEFNVGAKKFHQLDYEQAWDYGLDLKNFHAPSHAAAIFPILCATEAPAGDRRWKPPHADGVRPPFCCSAAGLGTAIALTLDEAKRGHSAFPDEKQNVPFLDPGQLHLLSIGEPRQDSRHGAREQRLPFAWRSDQQEVVAAGRVWAWRRFRLTCRRRGPSTSLSPALLRFPSQLGDWST